MTAFLNNQVQIRNKVINNESEISKQKINIYDSETSEKVINAHIIKNNKCVIKSQENIIHHFHYPSKRNEDRKSVQFHLPNRRNSIYGKDNVFERISEEFTRNKITVICGKEGLGKTETAVQFIYKYQLNFEENLIWIDASTNKKCENSFYELATYLKPNLNLNPKDIKSLVQETYSYFEKKRVLFVFDDATNMQNLRTFLPSSVVHKNFDIFTLITSVQDDWGDKLAVVKLLPLAPSDSLSIISATLSGRFQNEDEEFWLELVEIAESNPRNVFKVAEGIRDQCKACELRKIEYSVRDFIVKTKDEMLHDGNSQLEDCKDEKQSENGIIKWFKNMWTSIYVIFNSDMYGST